MLVTDDEVVILRRGDIMFSLALKDFDYALLLFKNLHAVEQGWDDLEDEG